jgi:hypothetical protein
MAHIKHNAAPHDGAPVEEGATVEKGLGSEGQGNSGSAGGFGSVLVSDAVSQSNANASTDRGPHSYNYDSLIMTVSHIGEMAEQQYFVEGGAHAPGEETVPEPKNDEAVIFEDFSLRG